MSDVSLRDAVAAALIERWRAPDGPGVRIFCDPRTVADEMLAVVRERLMSDEAVWAATGHQPGFTGAHAALAAAWDTVNGGER